MSSVATRADEDDFLLSLSDYRTAPRDLKQYTTTHRGNFSPLHMSESCSEPTEAVSLDTFNLNIGNLDNFFVEIPIKNAPARASRIAKPRLAPSRLLSHREMTFENLHFDFNHEQNQSSLLEDDIIQVEPAQHSRFTK